MKNSIKIALVGVCAVLLTSCEKFLDRDPYGSTITQEQYDKMANKLEGSMRGIYSMMYTVTDHDEFGKRSIDMYTDLLSGDMALTNHNYGWFYTDENGQTATARTSYVWSYYYGMLRNVNSLLGSAEGDIKEGEKNPIRRVAKYGLPNKLGKDANKDEVYYKISDSGDTVAVWTESEAEVAYFYAQALAMRGYIYSNLVMLYCNTPSNVKDFKTELCFPMYNSSNMETTQGLSVMSDVYSRIEDDLYVAIMYLDAFSGIERASKLEIDANVARGILAYSYLNKGRTNAASTEASRDAYTKAYHYARTAIANSTCQILPINDLYETGFNDVNNNSWMWGQAVTTETAGGLASFFGQCDIHSYSYAWAGDTKAIDENLYNQIKNDHPFDARIGWFNDGKKNSTYKLCADGKFYSAKARNTTKADDIDREWLSDNVFMRIESMYLIAAEACYRLNDDANAIKYLKALLDERVLAGSESVYGTYISGLNHSNLLEEIGYNWRVELWGEGYGLMTFRRLGAELGERKRGGNHDVDAGSKMELSSKFILAIPGAETSYNPKITTTEL